MAIKEVEDPINGGTVTLLEGVVQQISAHEIKGGTDKFGNTHRMGVNVDGDWANGISVKTGEGYVPAVRYNAGTAADVDWQSLEVGDKVRIVVQPNEYNGKTYYNSGVSKIKLLEKGSGQTQQAQGGQKKASGGFKRDNTGVVAGNGFNAAKAFLGGCDDENEFIQTAKKLVDIGQKLRDKLKESRPDLDDYSVGAQSGMALIAACEWAEDIEDVEVFATDILNNILPEITEYVKSLEEEKPAVVKKTVVKKAAKKTTKKTKVEASPEQVDDSEIPVDAYTDDIPF